MSTGSAGSRPRNPERRLSAMRGPSSRISSAAVRAAALRSPGGATATIRPTRELARSEANVRAASGTPAMSRKALFGAPGSPATSSSGGPPASTTAVSATPRRDGRRRRRPRRRLPRAARRGRRGRQARFRRGQRRTNPSPRATGGSRPPRPAPHAHKPATLAIRSAESMITHR